MTLKEIGIEIQNRLPITITEDSVGLLLHIDGIVEILHLHKYSSQLVLSTDSWHEHFSNFDELNNFIKNILSGKIEIEVKYRGNQPVSHRILYIDNNTTKICSTTGSIFSPFWQKKTYKRMNYRPANRVGGGFSHPPPTPLR